MSKPEAPVMPSTEDKKQPATAQIRVPKGSLKVSLKGLEADQDVCLTIEGKVLGFDTNEYGGEDKSFRIEIDSLKIDGGKVAEKMSMKEYRASRE
jgi:hypothetical protein